MTRTKKALPLEDNQKAPESPEVTAVEPSAPVVDVVAPEVTAPVEAAVEAPEEVEEPVAEAPLPPNPVPVKEATVIITIGGSTRRDN